MARPRRDSPPEEFTTPELAVGADLTPRNVALLDERNLVLDNFTITSTGAGKAGNKRYNIRALQRIAIVGALQKAGVELLLAARLVAALADEWEAAYGHIPSKLDQYLHDKALRGRNLWTELGDKADPRNDYWLHHYLRTRTGIYRPRTSLIGDFCVEIVDRQYVFMAVKSRGGPLTFLGGETAEAMLRIVGWERGSTATVRTIAEEAGNLATTEATARYRVIEEEFHAARRNAVGALGLNVSLSIRNGLDALHEYRERRQ